MTKLLCCQGQFASFPRLTCSLDVMSDEARQNILLVTVKFKLVTVTSKMMSNPEQLPLQTNQAPLDSMVI